eukprot:m.13476 g.13476  ORF g.13476 m.13476 type:complete len:492 (-) comp9745_c0_seq1:116-1591(-)
MVQARLRSMYTVTCVLFAILQLQASGFQETTVELVDITPEDLMKAVQPVVDAAAKQHNTSFSVSIRSINIPTTSIFAGLDDRSATTQTKIDVNSRFPMGSVTKSWTAAAIMRMKELGWIDIDKPIANYVDHVLFKFNGTSMAALWNNDPKVNNITARLLMQMRAGLNDYEDAPYEAWTWEHPNQDWSPFDMLHKMNKTWVCGGPGICGHYASTGYEILGLALCQLQNCSDWSELDQKWVLPQSLKQKYNGVIFPEHGKCNKYPHMIHQYSLNATSTTSHTSTPWRTTLPENLLSPLDNVSPQHGVDVHFTDIINYSCLNGWSCGNIAATTESIANWYWDLLGDYKIVSEQTVTQMLNGTPLTNGWSPGLRYGLGLSHYKSSGDPNNYTTIVGHGGADWGSISHFAGYNLKFNFTVCIATSSVSGLNCSKEYRDKYPIPPGSVYAETFYDDVVCEVFDSVFQAMTNGSIEHLECNKPPKHHDNYTYTCVWDF